MGNFYTNVTLRGVSLGKLQLILVELGCSAIISPTTAGYTVVSERKCEEQDLDVLKALAVELSKRAHCPALAVLNHDDSQLTYNLCDDGNLVDAYCSCPSYFTGEGSDAPVGGDAARLLETFDVDGDAKELERVLRASGIADDSEFALEIDRHGQIAALLRMPAYVVGFGYDYVTAGDIPEGTAASELTTTGDAKVRPS